MHILCPYTDQWLAQQGQQNSTSVLVLTAQTAFCISAFGGGFKREKYRNTARFKSEWELEWHRFLGCVRPNIFHSIMIFMPNIWEGRFKLQGHCLLIMAFTYGMCVQPNVFHSILIFIETIWGGAVCDIFLWCVQNPLQRYNDQCELKLHLSS